MPIYFFLRRFPLDDHATIIEATCRYIISSSRNVYSPSLSLVYFIATVPDVSLGLLPTWWLPCLTFLSYSQHSQYVSFWTDRNYLLWYISAFFNDVYIMLIWLIMKRLMIVFHLLQYSAATQVLSFNFKHSLFDAVLSAFHIDDITTLNIK